jgi:hypothetical protein
LKTFNTARKYSIKIQTLQDQLEFLTNCSQKKLVPNGLLPRVSINVNPNLSIAEQTLEKLNSILRDAGEQLLTLMNEYSSAAILEIQQQLHELTLSCPLSTAQQGSINLTVERLHIKHAAAHEGKLKSLTKELRARNSQNSVHNEMVDAVQELIAPIPEETQMRASETAPRASVLADSDISLIDAMTDLYVRNNQISDHNEVANSTLEPGAPAESIGPGISLDLLNSNVPFVCIGTSRLITPDEARVLQKGQTFCPSTSTFDEFGFAKDLFELERALRLREYFAERQPQKQNSLSVLVRPTNKLFVPNDSRNAALDSYINAIARDAKIEVKRAASVQPTSNMSYSERNALRNLKNDQSIVIKQADKGSKTVIMGRDFYVQKNERQLSDVSLYKLLTEEDIEQIVVRYNRGIDALQSKILDRHVLSFLKVLNPKPGRYYGLPKIHKPGMPMRPIVSGNGTLTENASQLVDHLIKELPSKSATYIKNSDHFREKLGSISLPVGNNIILGTADITAMYNNIPIQEGIAAVVKHYTADGTYSDVVSPEALGSLIELVMTNNYFEFNDKFYLQLTGTSMGTRMAPPLAQLFMTELESNFFSTCSKLPYFICRYMDDYFYIWIGTEDELKCFLGSFNDFHPTIKLTYSFSQNSVNFLDITIAQNNGRLKTSLFHKPTDAPQYLHFKSAHPSHTKRSVPYSLALRSVRAHTSEEEAKKDLGTLQNQFLSRGYPKNLINNAIQKALAHGRVNGRAPQTSNFSLTPNLITTYHAGQPNFSKIFRKHYHIIESDPKLKELFPNPPGVTYRRAKNLKDSLVHSKVTRSTGRENCNRRNQQCGNSRCQVCFYVPKAIEPISSMDGSYTFTIRDTLTCSSENLVYMLQCGMCKKQYIGETGKPFRYRFNNHKSHVNSAKHLPVPKHVHQEDHPFSSFSVFLLKSGFVTAKDRLAFESYLIKRFKTDTLGLNIDGGILQKYLNKD